MPTEVSSDDLEQALMWVSASAGLETAAYVSRASGKVCFVDPDVPDAGNMPDDLEDDSLYAAVPHRNDLDLGRALVLRFVDEAAPELQRDVAEVFRSKGAYSRFKAILQRRGLLDAWHAYEADATRRALEQWAKAEGFVVVQQSGA